MRKYLFFDPSVKNSMFALLRDSNLLQKKERTLRSLDKNNKINRQEKESTTKEVTLMNSPGGEVFLGIRRGGVLPGSPNPGPISGPKSLFFSTPVSRPGL